MAHTWTSSPIARKFHECNSCMKLIAPGDAYEREAIPLHTTVMVFLVCVECKRW